MTNPEVGGSGDLLKEPKDEGKIELSDEDLDNVSGGVDFERKKDDLFDGGYERGERY